MTDSLENEVRELRSLYWSERDPEGRGFAPLADAYRRSGDLDEALELVTEGLERHPDFASGHVVAARVHLDRGDTDAASSSLGAVLELDGENTEALTALGAIHEEGDRPADALELFKRLATVAPSLPDLGERIRRLESSIDAAVEVHEPLEPVGGGHDDPQESEGSSAASLESLDIEDVEWDFGDADEVSEVPEEELHTQTLAELYAGQGLYAKAVEVYRHLTEAAPEDGALAARLAELEDKHGFAGEDKHGFAMDKHGSAGDKHGSAVEAGEATHPRWELDSVDSESTTAFDEQDGDRNDLALEALAVDMSTGADTDEDVSTPFVWSESAEEPVLDASGPPVSEYFAALLAWRPAAEPEAAEAVPIADLAPDAEAAVVALEAVPIESLAPDPAETIVPIESLAPDSAPGGGRKADEFRDWMKRLNQ